MGIKIKGKDWDQLIQEVEAGGPQGPPGVSIEYEWVDTQLGIKREDETEYQYVNLVGQQGVQGPEGPQGPVGPKGNTGPQGLQGIQGPQGDKGDTGPQGLKGDTGAIGPEGPTGPQGETGPMGPQGKSIEHTWNGTQLGVRIEGEIEYQYVDLEGPQGPQGVQGEAGPQGPQGIQGAQGPDGRAVEFSWNGTQLGVRLEGDTTYQYVNLKGEKGDTGPQGIKGDTGDTGPTGPKGETGDMGPKGDDGPQGPEGPPGNDGVEKGISLPAPSTEHRGKFYTLLSDDGDRLYYCVKKKTGEILWEEVTPHAFLQFSSDPSNPEFIPDIGGGFT